jgi:hypothetical protein
VCGVPCPSLSQHHAHLWTTSSPHHRWPKMCSRRGCRGCEVSCFSGMSSRGKKGQQGGWLFIAAFCTFRFFAMVRLLVLLRDTYNDSDKYYRLKKLHPTPIMILLPSRTRPVPNWHQNHANRQQIRWRALFTLEPKSCCNNWKSFQSSVFLPLGRKIGHFCVIDFIGSFDVSRRADHFSRTMSRLKMKNGDDMTTSFRYPARSPLL